MRILHLASSHRWTGAAEPATALAKTQIALGHEVAFACISGGSFWKKLRKRGVPRLDGFHFLPGVRPISVMQDMNRLRAMIAQGNYDVVHCHLTHDHWVAALALRSRRAGGPILVRTLHRDVIPGGDPIHQWLYRSATDLVVTVSNSSRAAMIERYGLPEEKVAWIRGAVDTERFHPSLDPQINRALWSIPPDAPVAGIVARMQAHRGHLEFIDTIDAVVREVPEARYIVSGRGENKLAVRERIKTHPLRKHLIETGYRKEDLPETYAAMDVSVLLARGSDGTCRAMLEAMACGRPVIGIRSGAIAETIEHGKTGWLIDAPLNHDQLATALIEALRDRSRTAQMGCAARAKMESDYTDGRRAEATLAAYERALTKYKTSESAKNA